MSSGYWRCCKIKYLFTVLRPVAGKLNPRNTPAYRDDPSLHVWRRGIGNLIIQLDASIARNAAESPSSQFIDMVRLRLKADSIHSAISPVVVVEHHSSGFGRQGRFELELDVLAARWRIGAGL